MARSHVPLTDAARSLRHNDAVQAVANDIRSAQSPEDISQAITEAKTEGPMFMTFLEDAAFDYALVQDGNELLGTPEDVALAAASLLDEGWQPGQPVNDSYGSKSSTSGSTPTS